MTNLMNQKVGGSKAASPAKCGAQSSKNKKVAAPVCVFENPEFGMVRTATDERGEPWFCAKDLCDALGYKRATDAVRQHVRSSDTAKYRIARTVKNRFGVSEGKVQNVQMNFVNESGFYALVLGSKLATAVKFKDWVTSVVLPQIRKTIAEARKILGDDFIIGGVIVYRCALTMLKKVVRAVLSLQISFFLFIFAP